MIDQELLSHIESPYFAATLGVVSTPRAFDRALLQDRYVRALMSSIALPLNVRHLQERTTELLDTDADPRYAHPHDLAVGVYLRVLDICSPDDAFAVAAKALSRPNLWWAAAMARRIMTTPNRGVPITSQDYVSPSARPVVMRSINSDAAFSPVSVVTAHTDVEATADATTTSRSQPQELSTSRIRMNAQGVAE
jgi:hypothetical protein